MSTTIRVLLFLHSIQVVVAQTQPDLVEILKKVSETYGNVTQYEIVSAITMQDPKSGLGVPGFMRIAFKAPDKYQVGMRGAAATMGGDASGAVIGEVLQVYDGQNLWVTNPKSSEYRVYTVPHLPRDSSPETVDAYMGIGMYRRAVEQFGKGRVLREERIATDNGTADCFVVETAPFEAVVWIEKYTYHVLRIDGDGVSQVIKIIRLNEPISDDLFKFVPPPGAERLGKP